MADKKKYSAEDVVEMLTKDNPGIPKNVFAIYEGDDKTAVGVWHDELCKYIPFTGKLVTGEWLRLPPGELHIDGKSVWSQEKWKPCGDGTRPVKGADGTYVSTGEKGVE